MHFGSPKFVKMYLQLGLQPRLYGAKAKSLGNKKKFKKEGKKRKERKKVVGVRLTIAYLGWCDRFFNRLSFSNGKP